MDEGAPVLRGFADAAPKYIVGARIKDATPLLSGGVPTFFTVFPALPVGLDMDMSTGIISGVPEVVVEHGTYEVTASNAEGHSSLELVFSIAEAAPVICRYAVPEAAYTSGVDIGRNYPTVQGGHAKVFKVSPTLPAGLRLDTATGSIQGVPLSAVPWATYRVTTSNASGESSYELRMTVFGRPLLEASDRDLDNSASTVALPYSKAEESSKMWDVMYLDLSLKGYSVLEATYVVGECIEENVPVDALPDATFSVSPSLPRGLCLDAETGAISGTPAAESDLQSYTVTASSRVCDRSLKVKIAIVAARSPTRLSDVCPSLVLSFEGHQQERGSGEGGSGERVDALQR